MSQAAEAFTTRRGLFGGLALIAGAAALPATTIAAPVEKTEAELLIERMERGWGETGRRVAEMAVADGFGDIDLYTIMLGSRHKDGPTILMDGKDRGLGMATYSPRGRI